MKVNISGMGVIPGLNMLSPVRGVELDERGVRRLLNYRQFKVYEAETGRLITPKSVDEFFKMKIKPSHPPAQKKVAPVVEKQPEPVVETKVEPVVEPVIETVVEEEKKEEYIPPVITIEHNISDVEETEEETVDVEPVIFGNEEVVEVEAETIDEVISGDAQPKYHKKKKKNRNN